MMRGSFGVWSVAPVDFRKVREVVVPVLEAEGNHVQRRRITEHDLKSEGVWGSRFLARLGHSIPFGGLIGLGSRIRARVHCRRSLSKGDTALRLLVHLAPIEELDWTEEEYGEALVDQERMGDSRGVKQCFERLTEAPKTSGIIQPTTAPTEG